jgi:hypothetical protein
MHTDSSTLTEIFLPYGLKKIIPIHFLGVNKRQESLMRQELKPLKEKLFIPNDLQTITL